MMAEEAKTQWVYCNHCKSMTRHILVGCHEYRFEDEEEPAVTSTNAIQRPIRAASNVIRAGIGNFRVPSLIDLPHTSAFSSISGRFWMVPRFVRNNPFGYLRIHASGFGGTFNIRPNP